VTAVLAALSLSACATPAAPVPSGPGGAAAPGPGVTLVAAGDVACGPDIPETPSECRQEDTAKLVEGLDPDSVLVLGDTAYETVTAESLKAYDASWGRFLDRTHAVVGNHEYYGEGADAYWDYFADRAGDRGAGWYSYDLGAWHVVVLNSECDEVGCDAGSDQGRWLAEDLAAHPARCTVAAFHRPRFSSGEEYGDDESVSGFWQVLQEAGVDVVLNGHEHSYERFAPQRDSGRPTAEEGMAEFVVGTGGRDLRGFGEPKPNSEVRWNASFGVLALTLRSDGYDWRFHATDGADVDSGSASCR
jgi:acid phosphatase type 7